jgi:protein required for attachment to host cells
MARRRAAARRLRRVNDACGAWVSAINVGCRAPLIVNSTMKNWFVIANASRARVLEEGSRAGRYVHVADLVHPQSRQKGIALAGDRPGHAHAEGAGFAGTSFAPHTDPRERERDRFAQEVARLLDQGIADGRCAGLVLAASSPFLGHLKTHLGAQAKKAIVRTLDADYTALSDRELSERLTAGQVEP